MPNLKLGIVGLPNVGKSSLFNALTAAGAAAENYPFCTVEPNVGVVEVPDPRLDLLTERVQPRATVPATVTFVDIAGLVKGASKGEGLGNQFLAHVREVDAIVHVVRCFEDDDVAHVLGSVDPVRDREIIHLELALSDLQLVERRFERVEKLARTGEDEAKAELSLLGRLRTALAEGRPARLVTANNENEARWLRGYQLLTTKPVLYLANVAEDDVVALASQNGAEASAANPHVAALRVDVRANSEAAEVIPVAARIEAELAELPANERAAFLSELGLREPGLNALVRAGYRLLGLVSFFTAGEKEVRAWTIRDGTPAAAAAGEIHSDFERGFIRAETVGWKDFLATQSLKVAREQGLVRSEGKEYVVQDGDILLFRFNVSATAKR